MRRYATPLALSLRLDPKSSSLNPNFLTFPLPMASVTIHTTQNVSIDYELAKTGTRIGSFMIDLIILIIIYFLLVTTMAGLLDFFDGTVFGLLPLFLILLYFFFSEMLSRGQTLGKRIVGLRVIRLDGQDPTPADFLTRAVFLLPDVIFSGGVPAVLLVSSSRHAQRLGDIVAGTVVIHTSASTSFTLEEIMSIRNRDDHEPEYPGVQRFTDADMMVVKQALARWRRYGNPAHRRAVRQLAVKMADILELDKAAVPHSPEKFLEILLLDYIVLTR
jgi:uncharacterized RDD family membrane protein YckC